MTNDNNSTLYKNHIKRYFKCPFKLTLKQRNHAETSKTNKSPVVHACWLQRFGVLHHLSQISDQNTGCFNKMYPILLLNYEKL